MVSGVEAGKPLASSNRIAKIAFTGGDDDGPVDHAVRQPEPDPGDPGVGGKSPNIFFSDVLASNDAYQDKALEGVHDVRPESG